MIRFHWNKPVTTNIYVAMNYAWNKRSLKMNFAIGVQFARFNKRLPNPYAFKFQFVHENFTWR